MFCGTAGRTDEKNRPGQIRPVELRSVSASGDAAYGPSTAQNPCCDHEERPVPHLAFNA